MLLNLPNEVLSYVVAELTPDDLINTALSCKTIFNFCKYNGNLKRHMDHQKAYTVLNIGSHGLDPLDLVEKLNEDWRVAYYVKGVHFKCPKTGPLFTRKPHGGLRYLMNTTEFASKAMLVILEPLLLLLPNLGRLRFIDFPCQPSGLNEVYVRADGRQVLTKLEVVEFVRSEAPTPHELEWGNDMSCFEDAFHPWGFLPSVHTLRAENIIWVEDFTERYCQITTLELINCSVDINGFERFLEHCKNLKRFTYHWNLGPYLHELFGKHGLFYVLNRYCRKSLEYLRITGGLPPWCLMLDQDDLTRHGRLKETHLSLDLFVDAGQSWEDWLSVERHESRDRKYMLLLLHEFLPPYIEVVTIDVRENGWKSELTELLGHVLRNQWTRRWLPLLKSVIVECDKLTADEVKKSIDFLQRQSDTIEIKFRLVDVK